VISGATAGLNARVLSWGADNWTTTLPYKSHKSISNFENTIGNSGTYEAKQPPREIVNSKSNQSSEKAGSHNSKYSRAFESSRAKRVSNNTRKRHPGSVETWMRGVTTRRSTPKNH